jgi:anaphase-promoting complex subunit 6
MNGHAGPSYNSSHFKGKGRENDRERLSMGPGGMIEIPEDMVDGVSRLVDMSVACRYLAAQCLVCPGSFSLFGG